MYSCTSAPLHSFWRHTILKEFVPDVAKLTLVSDPDCLLSEEKLAIGLRERGFDIIEFSDPIEFRYAYESKYRSIWDRGDHTDLVVVLRLQDAKLDALPYDLLQAGRKLAFNLGEIFPNMSYPIVEELDRSLLDSLFEAQQKNPPDRMGDNATKDFILRYVFGVAAELISTEVELLRSLLRLHYGKTVMPDVLADRLVEVLENSESFKGWSLAEIVSDAEQFFAFIQERWPIFLGTLEQTSDFKETLGAYDFKIAGPVQLPFDHQDIRVYIDNLFVEGKLTPVDQPGIKLERDSWILSGITTSKAAGDDLRVARLFELVDQIQLSKDSRYDDWLTFAMKWGELSALVYTSAESDEYKQRHSEIGGKLNELFASWLEGHYAGLINLPPSVPAMLHHVPRHMARYVGDKKRGRVALLVIDGLSLGQWVTMRNVIQSQSSGLILRESAVFAWIPTVTSVSRQSVFSGKPPIYFPASINSTNNDEKLWKQFWQDHGVSKFDIAYKRGLGGGDAVAAMESFVNPSQTQVVGLVIDKVDKIMH